MTGDVLISVLASDDPGYIADYIAQNIAMRASDKQGILEELRPVRRLEKLSQALGREVSVLELEQEMQSKVRDQLTSNQRDYYLREQLKVIQNELGEGETGDGELGEYREKISKAKLPKEVEKKLNKELDRLSKQPFGSAEATVIRNYLDVCLDLPWSKRTRERTDVKAARKVLDADHYGLDKVKERVLEFLAVKQLAPELKGQVLCLVGPPGVGKTSIAMSVARATGRRLARISLGGIHDEAEIRGHRKAYVGAMPGRIIDGVRHAGSANPLLLLDEIDKLASDIHGDPASALLEVLDGEQNATFRDHFLEVPFDLSDVLFITTANTTDTIPRPLLDRMEVIELSSYTDEEKLQIVKNHLLPKELKRHGLKKSQLKLTDDAIREVITGYTRESGPVWRWDTFYIEIIRSIFDGAWDSDAAGARAVNYWWGMRSGAEEIDYSKDLPAGTLQLLDLMEKMLSENDLRIFPEDLYAQGHVLHSPEAVVYSPKELMEMDWLDECVEGALPHYDELDVKTHTLMSINGLNTLKGFVK